MPNEARLRFYANIVTLIVILLIPFFLGVYFGMAYQKSLSEVELHASYPLFRSKSPQNSVPVPIIVRQLCNKDGGTTLETESHYTAVFRGPASEALRCSRGQVWKVQEEPVLPESGVFYFNQKGKFLDVCNALENPSGCKKFGDISCEDKNYCH